MSTKRLTPLAKGLIVLLVLLVLGGVFFTLLKLGVIEPPTKKTVAKTESVQKPDKKATTKPTVSGTDTINLSIDEWIGFKPIIDANGGLTTQPGSIYDTLGIKVNINVINDAVTSSNALIKGELNAAGYTINRTAFLSNKFKEAGLDVVMPYITNYSNGGDGIIATNEFQTVESLVNARIGVPEFSESEAMVIWFINQSDLTSDQKKTIIDNLIMFSTPDEVAKAMFAGQIDVAATWQPYLTQARTTNNCHVLFSTENSTKLVLDGVLFNKDFAEANSDLVSKFIDGTLQANSLYTESFDIVRNTMPMLAGNDDKTISDMTGDAALTTYVDNLTLLKEDGPTVYTDMCDVWKSLNETVDEDLVTTLFDTKYIDSLSDKYSSLPTENNLNTVVVTEDNKQSIIDSQALMSKSVTINFDANTCNFTNNAEASTSLNDFVSIAKTLDGTIIQIEGNVASDNTSEAEMSLSELRAETVKQYLVVNGIDARRIITVGNGGTKPLIPNKNPDGSLSKEGTDANRRTDIYFKVVE